MRSARQASQGTIKTGSSADYRRESSPCANRREKIEILSTDLLGENRPLVKRLQNLARSLRLEFGWHYLLDLVWILEHLGPVSGKCIMDAGAGTGILQWFLAQEGAELISADRISRASLPLRFRTRFRVQGLRKSDLLPSRQAFMMKLSREVHGSLYRQLLLKVFAPARDLLDSLHSPRGAGCVLIYNQDLKNLVDLQEDSFDAVVSVSALEHNTPEELRQIVKELMRVLKPDGMLLATLTAARDQDWWHEASSGWCYTDTSLRRNFNLSPVLPSNYDQYDELFKKLRNCAELRQNLAKFYFKSDEKGMPKGIWDPEYQPVGVCKLKKI